ncbi:MAG TPA: four helix bundle protein [Niabella sp.]|mgnify:CR=1 FL=1|nr:four helix bundle protein [Niabella sp.]
MKSYRDLNIYKESHRLATEVHHLSLLLPKFELYEEGSQIRRSAKAVSTAIVEGYGRRRYKAEFIRFLVFSQSECDETIEHLDYLYETKSLTDKETYNKLKETYTSLVSRLINLLIGLRTIGTTFQLKIQTCNLAPLKRNL